MDVDRAWIERLKVDPANVAAQLVALTNVSDWARGMHRENFDGYLLAAAELLTRPTPDGEIGELVGARELAAKIMVAVRRAGFPKEYVAEAHDEFEALTLTPLLATTLETQAADIARLRELLCQARHHVVFTMDVDPNAADLANAIDALLATRTDVAVATRARPSPSR